MNNVLKGTKIWKGDVKAKDTYVDFKCEFKTADNNQKVYLRISCDSNYSVWINGTLAGFAACADYPEHRNYDKIDVTKFCKADCKNDLKITVWHYGENSQTYINADAFLLFDIVQGNKTVLKSDKTVLSAINYHYKNGHCKVMSPQMGLGFAYDATATDGEYSESETYGDGVAYLRKQKQCRLKRRVKTSVKVSDGGYLVDLGKETVGFADLQFKSEAKQKIKVSYAEHLTDGKVEAALGGRDFSFGYTAAVGENSYINTFRRIAGRYIFVEVESPIEIEYIGVRPVEYPLIAVKRNFKDDLLQKIYDTCIYTLKCCMHEHYEDCPWREQALYVLDSRNQMLCGYYAFKGAEYQRSNLVLISRGLRKDGLLSLCFPAGNDYPIPFFSLAYVMQVWEYIEYTGDYSVLKEVENAVRTIMKTFSARMEEGGLIADFEYPYWNFYEWTDGSDNEPDLSRKKDDYCEKKYDLILNCFYIVACGYYERITGERINTEKTAKSVMKTFYNAEKKSFKLCTLGEAKYSQLGNSMAILAGVADENLLKETAKTTVAGDGLTRVSLSMNGFFYDALLKIDKSYKDFVLGDIKAKYGKMLEAGATTFWETELGWEDFGGAGSLCHGWSALPVYYLNTLLETE